MSDLDAGHVESGITHLDALHGHGQGFVLVALQDAVLLVCGDVAILVGDIAAGQVNGQGRNVGGDSFFRSNVDGGVKALSNCAGDQQGQQQKNGNDFTHQISSFVIG